MLLRGMVTPLATPLHGGMALDHSGLEALIERVIAGGVQGIFVLGTTGEGPSLPFDVRAAVIRQSCSIAHGRVLVLAAVSDTVYSDTVRLSQLAAEAGADAVVAAPPYYFRYSQDELLAYVARLCGDIELPLWLYNIPSLTKVAFEPETVSRAAELPGIAGLKDSSFDMEYLRRVIELVKSRPDFSVMVGPEEKLLEGLGLGAHGGVCGGSNLHPALLTALLRAFRSGDLTLAVKLQNEVNAMGEALYTTGDPSSSYMRGMKCALGLLGIGDGRCAPPFGSFLQAQQNHIADGLRSLGLLQT